MPLIIALFANLEEVIAIYRLPKTSIPYTNEAGIPIDVYKRQTLCYLFVSFVSAPFFGGDKKVNDLIL